MATHSEEMGKEKEEEPSNDIVGSGWAIVDSPHIAACLRVEFSEDKIDLEAVRRGRRLEETCTRVDLIT